MNWLDILIIIGLAISLIIGIWAGLIRTLFILAGMIIGVVLAGQYSEALGEKLSFISSPGVAGIIAFIIILLATLLVVVLLAIIVQKIAHWVLLGWLDRIGGGILGLLLGAIFIGAMLAMYMRFQGSSDVITSSPLASFLVDKFWIVLGLLPDQFDYIRNYF
jgi:membrane protein required for colicin V production